MNKIERDIQVLRNLSGFDRISYVQGTNAIPIIFHIKDYDIPPGSMARVYVKRPDGTIEYDLAVISGNDVTINVKSSMFSVVGNSLMQIKIIKEESVLVTFGTTVCVEQNYIDDTFKSENSTDIFDGMVEEVKTYMEDTKKNAADSADSAENYSKQAKSYAKGTGGEVRPNDDSDCAEFYYEQVKRMAQGVEGIIPMGTITFAELSLPHNEIPKYMFDISDDFVTDERFKNGSDIYYGAGSNVIRTADNMWDVLAPVSVSGVKGDKESTFRQGLVNITPDDIGIQGIGKTLKEYPLIGAGADMDDYKAPGNYCVHSSNLDSLRNKPPIPDNTAACIFRVEEGYTSGLLASKPAVRQRFQQFLRPYIWERCLYNESWTDWELVQTSEPLNMQSGWSLSGGTEIAENADLNASEYLEIGNYYCPTTSAAETLFNCPIENAFTMKVELSADISIVRQTIRPYNTGDVYVRILSNDGSGLIFDWMLIAADQSKKLDASRIVENIEITEPGFLMDGKTASEKFTAVSEELSGKQDVITGGASTVASSNLTASRALISNGSGKIAVSTVTAAEIKHLAGAKSNIQTQINNIDKIKGKNGSNMIQFLWNPDMTCTLYVDNTRIGNLNYTK